MNRSQLVRLADAIHSLQPGWQQPGILSQLQQLDQGWTGTDAGLSVFAMQVAADPNSRNPGALNATPQPVAKPIRPTREPRCYDCGRTQSACMAHFDWEVAHGVPDPHNFESAETAELRSANRVGGTHG